MKRTTYILLSMIILLGLSQCKTKDQDSVSTTKENEEQGSPSPDIDEEDGVHLIILEFNLGGSLTEEQFESISNNNLDEYFKFEGQKAEKLIDKEDIAHANDKIIWAGRSPKDANFKIEIVKIRYIDLDDVLTETEISGCNGVVAADVKSDAEEGQVEKYAIDFRLVRETGRSPIYTIDPKLRILR